MNAVFLLLLAFAHGVVDAFALFIQPLWPDLQARLRLDDATIQAEFLLWSVAGSLSQVFFGMWGDRWRSRWLIWAGPAVAVLSLSCVGAAPSAAMLTVLLLVGGLGVGAFHPEAAALVGVCAPEARNRAMSVFVIGGTIGVAAGPVYSGLVATRWGLESLAWSIAWGLPVVALVALGLRGLPAESRAARVNGLTLRELCRLRGSSVMLMLVVGVLRVIPVVGVMMGLAYMLKGKGGSTEHVGIAQSVFQFATGLGMLGCAFFVRSANERLALWLLPVLATPAVLLCPVVGYPVLLACLAVSGILFGAAAPILITYGQRLLPDGQRLASSITMGVTWGLGGAIVAGLMTVVNGIGRPDLAFYVFAPAGMLSSVACLWLPRLSEQSEPLAAPAALEPVEAV